MLHAGSMTTIKDWVLSQVVSKTIGLARPPSASESFLSDDSLNEEVGNRGSTQSNANLIAQPVSTDASGSSTNMQTAESSPSTQAVNCNGSNLGNEKKHFNPLSKIEALQINLLRVISRLGLPQNDLIVAKVLYRIHLATLIRAEESDLKRANLKVDRARAIAAEQEITGLPELDFSLKILVLGKTGVGKSSTINSIFGESKVATSAFRPATDKVQEIVGVVNGVKLSFIDTPGLLPSSSNNVGKNRKILHSVKRCIRKSRPDVILYFERLDCINSGYYDFPLLKLITEILGSAIWFSTNIVLTHSSASLPEGPNGYPLTYDSYISYCTEIMQHHIQQTVSDAKLESPVIFVENHPSCKMDASGRKILPDGQPWTPKFMLLCICTKTLGDVNKLLGFEDSIHLGPLRSIRIPSLPHLLSSFLNHSVQLKQSETEDLTNEVSFSDEEEEDEYDQLPPIRILTRAQVEKLTSSQKKSYLEELDYRETLFLKKQLKREYFERVKKNDNLDKDEGETPDALILSDMAIPSSFDPFSPAHRYRFLVTNDQWIARPVLDAHGWDHEVGFDGINLEIASELHKNIFTSVIGQMSKDKQDLNVKSELTTAFMDPSGNIYSVGLDLQSATANEYIRCIRANTKLKSFKHNFTECGISMTSFENKNYYGAKIEDSFTLKRRMKFKVNAGGITDTQERAYGGSFEAILRGKDYPVRDEKVSFLMTILSCKKEIVLGGELQSDFRVTRGTTMSVNANMNSRQMGQVRLKINSSERIEIAFVAIFSVLRSLLKKKSVDNANVRVAVGT